MAEFVVAAGAVVAFYEANLALMVAVKSGIITAISLYALAKKGYKKIGWIKLKHVKGMAKYLLKNAGPEDIIMLLDFVATASNTDLKRMKALLKDHRGQFKPIDFENNIFLQNIDKILKNDESIQGYIKKMELIDQLVDLIEYINSEFNNSGKRHSFTEEFINLWIDSKSEELEDIVFDLVSYTDSYIKDNESMLRKASFEERKKILVEFMNKHIDDDRLKVRHNILNSINGMNLKYETPLTSRTLSRIILEDKDILELDMSASSGSKSVTPESKPVLNKSDTLMVGQTIMKRV